MKKLITMFGAAFLLLLLVACEGSLNPETSADMLLSVEINPKIEFIVGDDEKVKSYTLKNEDAEIVAAGLDLVGMNYEDALKAFLNEAIDTGYIDITRNDNAVALMAANGDSDEKNQFQETVQTKLQTFFQENAIGAVVLNHGELDTEIISFSETHDVSLGIAKLMFSYIEINAEAELLDVLEMTPAELTDGLIAKHQTVMNTYRSQHQEHASDVKDEMAAMIQSQVQAHREAVIAGTATQPDMTGIMEQYENNYEGMKDAYAARNAVRKNDANDRLSGEVPRLLSMDINPQVDLIIDANGYVYSIMYQNEDAEIVGAGLDLVGLAYQEALELYMHAAIDTGYIDITRDDNGVALMAGSLDEDLDEQFRIQIQNQLQTFFQENAIGAVVLNKTAVNEELEQFVELYEVSYGFAKLALAYKDANPDVLMDDILGMSPSDLIEAIAAHHMSAYATYQDETEANALMIKNEMKLALQAQVQAYRDDVQNGTATQPDLTGVEQAYLNNYAAKVQSFTVNNEQRKSDAQDKIQEGQGSVLSVDINPKLEMVIDPEGYVISYMFKNEDAEIVGAGLELLGLHYEVALQQYLNAALDTGYIDVTRNDNAVAVQTSNMNLGEESALQIQVQTQLQTFFQENAIGAVVLSHGEIDEDVQLLVDEYEISVGYAKLILTYLETHTELTVSEVLLLPIQELIVHLVEQHKEFQSTYQNERELGAQAIKDELADALMSQVQAHRQAVTNGTAVQPDTTGVKAAYLADYELMHQAYVLRNEVRKNEAKGNINGGNS